MAGVLPLQLSVPTVQFSVRAVHGGGHGSFALVQPVPLAALALAPPLRPLQSQVRVVPQVVRPLSLATSPAAQVPAVVLLHAPGSGTMGAHGPVGAENTPLVQVRVALPL